MSRLDAGEIAIADYIAFAGCHAESQDSCGGVEQATF